MKFSDIEQFIRSGSYEVDAPMDHLEGILAGWEKTYGLELNPDFQRGHVWTEEQQIAYLEFLFKGGITAKVIYFNSPAFGRTEGNVDLDETILCIDGLQRLTSCLRFVRDEIKLFGHYYSEFKDTPRMKQCLKLNMNCLGTRAELLQWYLQFNTGGTVHTKEELDRVRMLLEEELQKNK